jgi:hypothetical protein
LHALAETMYGFAAASVWLKCTFHVKFFKLLTHFTFSACGETGKIFILTTDHHARPATGGVKGEAKLRKNSFNTNKSR